MGTGTVAMTTDGNIRSDNTDAIMRANSARRTKKKTGIKCLMAARVTILQGFPGWLDKKQRRSSAAMAGSLGPDVQKTMERRLAVLNEEKRIHKCPIMWCGRAFFLWLLEEVQIFAHHC